MSTTMSFNATPQITYDEDARVYTSRRRLSVYTTDQRDFFVATLTDTRVDLLDWDDADWMQFLEEVYGVADYEDGLPNDLAQAIAADPDAAQAGDQAVKVLGRNMLKRSAREVFKSRNREIAEVQLDDKTWLVSGGMGDEPTDAYGHIRAVDNAELMIAPVTLAEVVHAWSAFDAREASRGQ